MQRKRECDQYIIHMKKMSNYFQFQFFTTSCKQKKEDATYVLIKAVFKGTHLMRLNFARYKFMEIRYLTSECNALPLCNACQF